MTDRVLDQRLQRERQHETLERVRVDVLDDTKAFAETQVLERQIGAHEPELLLEWHFLAALTIHVEHVAQQRRELLERALAVSRIDPHERRDGVQRVEQEVRIELRTQRAQLGVDLQRLRARRPTFLLAKTPRRLHRIRDAHHQPVERECHTATASRALRRCTAGSSRAAP